MSPFWLIILILLGTGGGFIYYVLSQMKDNEGLSGSAPTIVPGNVQVSNPNRRRRALESPPKHVPVEAPKEVPESPEAETPDPGPSEELEIEEKPKSHSRRVRFFENKEDIVRSFIIDLILDRKTK